MAINPKELQRFLDVWQPVIQALPAVINAAEYEAELGRHVAILESQRDEALAKTAEAAEQSAKLVAAAKDELKKLESKKLSLAQDAQSATDAMNSEVAAAKVQADLAIDALQRSVEDARKAADAERTAIAAATAEAAAAATTALDDLKQQVAELEKRKAAGEKALDALRAKLG